MNTQELYTRLVSEKINKRQFLEEVRKDDRYKNIISAHNSFDDIISILKSKGYIKESDGQKSENINFLDTFRKNISINEDLDISTIEPKHPKKKKESVDDVNYFEFEKGWRYELLKTDFDIEKAKKIAVKNIAKDPIYYTRLESGQQEPKKRTDLLTKVSKSLNNVKDKDNEMKPIKGGKKDSSNVSSKKDPKASKKPAGVKTMPGGSGEPKVKALKESIEEKEDKPNGKSALKSINKNYKGKTISFTFEDPKNPGDPEKMMRGSEAFENIVPTSGTKDSYTINFPGNKSLVLMSDNTGNVKSIYFDGKQNIPVVDVDEEIANIFDELFGKPIQERLKEAIRKIIKGFLKEYDSTLPNPDVLKKNLNRELKNNDWYPEVEIKNSQEQLWYDQRQMRIQELVYKLGKEGVDIYNTYAPDDKQMSYDDMNSLTDKIPNPKSTPKPADKQV